MTRKWRTISSRWQRQDPWNISRKATRRPKWREASSWGATRLRPEEYNQFRCGFEALAFRRQALSRGWAEVEGCRVHVSFAGENNCGAWDVLWVSHPRVILEHCMHNRRYPTLVSMIPRYQYLTINNTHNLVSMIPRYQYPSITCKVAFPPWKETCNVAFAPWKDTCKAAFPPWNGTYNVACPPWKESGIVAFPPWKESGNVAFPPWKETCNVAFPPWKDTCNAAFAPWKVTCNVAFPPWIARQKHRRVAPPTRLPKKKHIHIYTVGEPGGLRVYLYYIYIYVYI